MLIKETWDETSPSIIQSGFKKGGIYPFDDTVISQDKFDPAALNRWKQSQNEDSHVTAEAEITHSPVESPSEANLALREVNPTPSTSTADMSLHSFEEILIKTMKSRGTQDSVKPKKRIAQGAEVITREELLQCLKAREDSDKLKKRKSSQGKVQDFESYVGELEKKKMLVAQK